VLLSLGTKNPFFTERSTAFLHPIFILHAQKISEDTVVGPVAFSCLLLEDAC